MKLKEGHQLHNGKYRIIRVLGQGGFGITYLAMDARLGRLVAIKEFFPKEFCIRDNSDSVSISTQANEQIFEKLRKRFVKEARNLACLSHPNIVKIFEDFEENGTAYYVMEYIEGENLNELVKNNGPVSESKAKKYICQIGDAVDCIHSHQMTHFDIKPANIMLRVGDDTPILIDFGLSKDFGNGEFTTMLQAISPGYSPMELYNISSIQGLSPESDIYSLAATLYYLITGETPPYAADLRDDPDLLVFPSNVSVSTKNAIARVMTVARRERPKSVQTFTESLEGSYNRVGDHHRHNSSFPEDENTRFVNEEDNSRKSQYSDSASHREYENISFPQPKERKNNALFWIVIAAVVAIILFVVFGYVVDGDVTSPSAQKGLSTHEMQNVQESSTLQPEQNNLTGNETFANSSAGTDTYLYGPFVSKESVERYIESFYNNYDNKIYDPSFIAPNISTDFGKLMNFTRDGYIAAKRDYSLSQNYIRGNREINKNSFAFFPLDDGGIKVQFESKFTLVCEKEGLPYTRVFKLDTELTFNKDRQIISEKERSRKINEWNGY